MPPSFGGTSGGASTVESLVAQRRASASRSSSAFWNTPPDSATVSSPSAARPCRQGRRPGRDRGVEPGADHAGRRRRRAHRATTARDHRRRVDDRRRRRRRRRRTRTRVAPQSPSARQALQLDGRLRLVGDDLAGRRPAPRPRRTAGPCWRSARSRARSRVGAAARAARRRGRPRTGGRSVVPRHARRPQVRQRHPVGRQHADVAAGQRHVRQVREPPEALVVGEQHLAAPDGAVGAVAGAVERERRAPARRRPARARPSPRRCARGGAGRCAPGARRRAARPGGGAVAGMRVGDKDRPGRRRSSASRCRSAASKASSVARSSMSPMCWLSQA